LNPWLRFKTMELPFATLGLVWNSIMSWSGGWFFLMAAETFIVGSRNFSLPGFRLLSPKGCQCGRSARYHRRGLVTLILVIVGLDQFVWRPVLAWANKFKVRWLGRMMHQLPGSWMC